eukprot:GHUV01004683.1.p1 GENE.GHUV01004683.1~~GHUV01004683.1.p1  ORF type:complete len:589 (+),score=226.44 GHUV01004683.1:456-2222(+)
MHASGSLSYMRTASHRHASTSSYGVASCRCRCQRLQVHAALFEPPPFQPKKLSVQYLAGARPPNSLSAPVSRRYTLTHNDITGALNLSIGLDYNHKQIQGFYTHILRDEITAEWYFTSGAAAPAELHIYCHVSGEERWLAPPQLRNFIFRREMTLVLDTFYYADKEFLQRFPGLMKAKVYVHFQSDVQDLDLREYWGTLGDRRSWRRMPRGVLARLKLLLFGFPALPHSRPRSSLTWQQQQRQQQQAQGLQGLVPLAAAASAAADTADVAALVQDQQQRHPVLEAVGEQTRPVALSLQQQRKLHPQEVAPLQEVVQQQQGLQQNMSIQSSNGVSCNGGSSSSMVDRQQAYHLQTSNGVSCNGNSSVLDRRQAYDLQQQQQLQAELAAAAAPAVHAATSSVGGRSGIYSSNGGTHSSNGSSNSSVSAVSAVDAVGPVTTDSCSNTHTNGTSVYSNGTGTSSSTVSPAPQDAEQLQQQLLPEEQLVSHGAAAAPVQQQQQVQQREQVLAFADAAETLQDHGYWVRPGSSLASSSSSYSSAAGGLVPVVALDKTVPTLQTVLQQQPMSRRSTVVAAAASLRTSSSVVQPQQ